MQGCGWGSATTIPPIAGEADPRIENRIYPGALRLVAAGVASAGGRDLQGDGQPDTGELDLARGVS